MAGRAGRPQFDSEGIAIALAPEEVVQEARKEIKSQSKGRSNVDESKIWRACYSRAQQSAKAHGDATWDREGWQRLVEGAPAPLSSRTKITADVLLAVGFPDLAQPEADHLRLPAHSNLNIRTVIASLLLPDFERRQQLKTLDMVTANLRALGVLDEHGQQVKGQMIRKLRGVDGPFVYYALLARDPDALYARAMCEYLVDHDAVWKIVTRAETEKKREWNKNRLRERRREETQISWEDVEAEYDKAFPRELTEIEKVHAELAALLPHPELHGGKKMKTIWAEMEDQQLGFLDYVDKHDLAYEEGNLFSYLARVMRVAHTIFAVTEIDAFGTVEDAVRRKLAVIDDRVMDPAWM
jgi:hypothetical protein